MNILLGQTDSVTVLKHTVYPAPEIMAKFPGGEKAMLSFISKNIDYPRITTSTPITGVVYVEFDIDELGGVKNPRIIKGLGYGIDESVIKMVKKIPRWEPAIWAGKPGSCVFVLPVGFE